MNLPSLQEIAIAQKRIEKVASGTALVPHPNLSQISLKLECHQPYGSYKIRGVLNAVYENENKLKQELVTVSAGNMAQAVAGLGKERGLKVRALVPETTPQIKKDRIQALGAALESLPFSEIWKIVKGETKIDDGFLIHPLHTKGLFAGYATIAVEILEQAPETDALVVPLGLGGLLTGIITAVRLLKPEISVYAAEIEEAAPLHEALQAKMPVFQLKRKTFADALGTPEILSSIWKNTVPLLSGSLLVSESRAKETSLELYEKHGLLIEGAASVAIVASESLVTRHKNIVAIVSGGNRDPSIPI
jgi:threonine dehydratase